MNAFGRTRKLCPRGTAPIVTYEILRETRRGFNSWAIRRLVDGKAQDDTVGLAMRPGATLNIGLSNSSPTRTWMPKQPAGPIVIAASAIVGCARMRTS